MNKLILYTFFGVMLSMLPIDALDNGNLATPQYKSSADSSKCVLHLPEQFDVVASGLYNPEGFTITPDGIYIAQVGLTVVPTPPPPGIVTTTGRITKITRKGKVQIIADNVIGAQGSADGFEQENIGVDSVAWLNGSLYALVNLGPASGLLPPPISVSGVYKVDPNTGAFTLIADVNAFDLANCNPLNPNCPATFTALFDMVAWQGKLYVSNGHTDVIDAVDPSQPLGSNIQRFADFTGVVPGEPHPVLTGLGVSPDHKYLYVVQATPYNSNPQPPNSARVWRISKNGEIQQVAQGYNYGQGVAVDIDGSIYVSQFAENITIDGIYQGQGSLVRWHPKIGHFETIIPNLTLPDAVRINGNYLYVTNYSQLGSFGDGQLVRINLDKLRIRNK